MVVVRRSTRSSKYRICPKQPPRLRVSTVLPDSVTPTVPDTSR